MCRAWVSMAMRLAKAFRRVLIADDRCKVQLHHRVAAGSYGSFAGIAEPLSMM